MDMITPVLNAILNFIFMILQVFLYAFLAVFVPLCFMLLGNFLYRLIFKRQRLPRRRKKRVFRYVGKFNPIKLLFWDFPKRLIQDLYEKDPDSFDTYGVHVFAGEQGSGKSIAAAHFIKMIKERNPCCHIASNINLNFQDSVIHDWTDILQTSNGSDGQVIFLDEIQNWFSSNESKNFPPEMLTEITQQRKQRKIVVGTSQVFTRISKPIREQITLLYKPMTIAGCLTVVRVYKVSLNDDGTVKKMKLRRWYCFVHDNELRNCYDTYEKVERLSIKGFQPRSEQVQDTASIVQNVNISSKK